MYSFETARAIVGILDFGKLSLILFKPFTFRVHALKYLLLILGCISILISLFSFMSSFVLQSRSLFVKNLNFKTSDESLRKHFSQQMKEGKVVSVRVFLSEPTFKHLCKILFNLIISWHYSVLSMCR